MTRFVAECADSAEFLAQMPGAYVDSLVTDPPSGTHFMQRDWDAPGGIANQGDYGSLAPREKFVGSLVPILRECFRVLKPGALGAVWAIPRTAHWTAAALERAGFTIEQVASAEFGTGFPKSHSVSMSIDKTLGLIGHRGKAFTTAGDGAGSGGQDMHGNLPGQLGQHDPISDEARRWRGYGTALKPAHERWYIVAKPFTCSEEICSLVLWLDMAVKILAAGSSVPTGTPSSAQNQDSGSWNIVTSWNGILGVLSLLANTCTTKMDAVPITVLRTLKSSLSESMPDITTPVVCPLHGQRFNALAAAVASSGVGSNSTGIPTPTVRAVVGATQNVPNEGVSAQPVTGCSTGRILCRARSSAFVLMPAHLPLDGLARPASPFLVQHAAMSFGSALNALRDSAGSIVTAPAWRAHSGHADPLFLYQSKADRSEREHGLQHRARQKVNDGRETEIDNPYQRGETERVNVHPTSKSITLMRWLVKLTNPGADGIVLDPFMGSGSTGLAALYEGARFIGIDREPEYVEISKGRLRQVAEDSGYMDRESAAEKAAETGRGVQLGLLR